MLNTITTPTEQRKPLTYEELLTRAQAESARLEKALKDLRQQDYELSTMRNRTDVKNLDAFHKQRKALFTQIFYLEADLGRSRGREAILRKQIAEGKVRVPELVVA